MIQATIARLLDREPLTREEAREAMHEIMRGEATQAQIAGFLVALRAKGETADEIAGCAEAMREHVLPVHPTRSDLVDTAGTGGDGKHTLNISTAAALVAAAAGVGVAKHGNRAASSQTGSADVLEALGFTLELPPERIARSIDDLGFGFMFAQAHHPAMRYAAPVRRELGTRTVFNVLGPLTNPARARAQVVGVYSPALVRPIAEALVQLGSRRAFVVHGAGGIDELSPVGPSVVAEVVDGGVRDRSGRRNRRRRPRRGSPGGHRARARGTRLGRGRHPPRGADRVLARGGCRVRFADALARPGLGAIAEVKRRSPSAGDLRPDADPAQLAAQFANAGAAAISVLVDERFGGTVDDLRAARAATEAPLLGKGFFATDEQVRELRDAGADAVLLILRDLDDATTAHLLAYVTELGMDALVEAHDADELQRAMQLDAPVIGINARDLTTFDIDRIAQLELVARAPRDRIVIAESGVHTRAQGAAAELAGADAILVGSSLMRAAEPQAKLRELLSRPLVKVCGLTRQADVDFAVEAGADLLGFILAEQSPRRADAVLDVPDTALSVAVFVTDTHETPADLVQFYADDGGSVRGREATLFRDGRPVARVLDQPWQQNDPVHWSTAAAAEGRVMLAGGLGPENVRDAIAAVRPWAVDASSSLEFEPGVKDHARVRAYIEEART